MAQQNWPRDAPTVQRWLHATLSAGDGFRMEGADRIRITVDLEGDDIETLDLVATGVNLRPVLTDTARPDGAADNSPPPTSAVVDRRAGVLHRARLVALPVRVHRIPIRIDAGLEGLPIEWLVYDHPRDARRPETAFTISSSGDARGTTGFLTASMRTDDVGRLLLTMIRPVVAESGLHLRRLTFSLVPANAEQTPGLEQSAGSRRSATSEQSVGRGYSTDPERFRLIVRATASWKLLRATVRIEARIRVEPSAVVAVEFFRIRSRNLLIAALLRIARSDIRGYEGKRYDLNDELATDGTMPRVRDLRVTAGKEVSISARLG